MNLAERLAATAARLPDKPALLFEGVEHHYGSLAERVARAAGSLRGLGLATASDAELADRVGVLCANRPVFVEALFATWHAGLIAVPVNPQYTPEEIAGVLADAGARAVVADAPLLPLVDAARDHLPALEHVVVAHDEAPDGDLRRWEELVQDGPPVEVAPAEDGSVALLQYTAGTTGRPKGAMLSHGNLLANHEQMAQTQLRVEERDVLLCVLPLFHIYGLNVVLAFGLARGATLLLLERFHPTETLRTIQQERVSIIFGAPPMYVAWLHSPELAEADLHSVRYATSGAAPLDATVLERFREQTGLDIWEGYGLTETAPLLTTVAMGTEVRPGSVGKPVPGVEIRLVAEDRQPVRLGDPGEVVVRGPNVFGGYWGQPDATAEVLDADGWFHTGDVGYAEDGYLYLVDRKTDLIIVSGFNVYPREVEDVLHRHPKIAQAAVVGVPHERTGECVKAFVVTREGEQATAAEVRDFAARHLARFKCPEIVELVDELPQLPTGKVLRRALRDG